MIYKRIKYLLLKNKIKKSSKLSTKESGKIGEDFAALTLELKGYKIIGRNIRIGGGEIDILATKDDSLYVFEVKLRNSDNFGNAVEAITGKKKKKLKKLTDILRKRRYKTVRLMLFAIDIKPQTLYYEIMDIE